MGVCICMDYALYPLYENLFLVFLVSYMCLASLVYDPLCCILVQALYIPLI